MKTMKYFILLLAISGFVFSCKKDNCSSNNNNTEGTDDYIVFGNYFGECYGEECIEIFKVENRKLFEDRKDKYPDYQKFYEGNFEEINPGENKFDSVKNLRGKLPVQLLNEKDTVIGQPDAGDWGGFYIEIKENGSRRFWMIDKMQNNIPAYLHPFINEVSAAINTLK